MDQMKVAVAALCIGAVGFLLRVLVALILEWARWPSRREKSRARGGLFVSEARSPGEKRASRKSGRANQFRRVRIIRREAKGRSHMQDILWTAVTIAFFTASIAYVHFCDRLK